MMVAGTCIGSGMIALPMVLIRLGLIPSVLLMLIIWLVMYYTSLISLELNLQAGRGLSLGTLGRFFSGRIAEIIGVVSIKLLSYALLAVFIYGGASVLENLLDAQGNLFRIESWYALVAVLVLLLPIKLIDYVNRILFIGLIAVSGILILGLASMISFRDMPLVASSYKDISIWRAVIPVVFTSFGFQVIFHTLTNYCNKNAAVLKKAFFWGSVIPAVVYIVWTCSVLVVVHHESPAFYDQMLLGKIEVGELVQELSSIAKWQSVQLLVWWISLLAIVTSVLGVGVGLCDSLNSMLAEKIPNIIFRKIIASIITILPAYIIAVIVPNAFIAVLGFAGMILAVIAILLPVYLFYRMRITQKISFFHYPELRWNTLIAASTAIGVLIILCEIINMLTR